MQSDAAGRMGRPHSQVEPVHFRRREPWHSLPADLPDSGQSLTLPSAPHFPLKDQFSMVLVLIVFILFKSVFLYVEGNNFLNTNH